ncbi:M48 family metallopeptidase [Rhodobacteraceae bacterium]|nr:M48 family metallopeptidase [Paracoccaceae bacterium]
MIRLAPILLAIIIALVMWRYSSWSLKRKLDAKSYPLKDAALSPYLDRLAAALNVMRLPVHVYQVSPVNGLAAPDGRIFLTQGFLDKFRSGEVTGAEITSVIAHELGHVSLGHSRRRMIDFSGQNVIRVVLTTVIGRFIPFIGPWLAHMATQALAARLSQQDEFEADEFATALMIKAGFGVDPQISLFQKLDRLSGSGKATPPAWLLTHPATDRRIAAIRAHAARWQRQSPTNS